MNYYNEIDPYAAQWLRNLIAAGHIAPGVVDERSIEDVKPDELAGFTQCHFFAGIGGWSLALRLAGWPDDRPIWTGSCPCQPFSSAGKGAGFTDERHLWPAWFHLIEQRRPDEILGEQVASKDGLSWLDLVCSDLEGAGYAVAPLDICAAGVGAPHIRQRLWFVADAPKSGREGVCGSREEGTPEYGETGGLANTERNGHDRTQGHEAKPCGNGKADGLLIGSGQDLRGANRPGPVNGLWREADWLLCRDGKWRPVEPGTFPLAHGVSSRVGRLRAYGNAINPFVAAEFIKAYMQGQKGF